MSVTISSDLVVDVMNAAPPRIARAATLRLTDIADGTGFATTLQGVKGHRPGKIAGDMIADVMSAAEPGRAAAAEQRLASLSATVAGPYKAFEAFMLRTAFEDMLPPVETGAFGSGFAGSVWRSMAAEQFASLFTDRGGIGLAKTLANRDQAAAAPEVAQAWPYFSTATLTSFAG